MRRADSGALLTEIQVWNGSNFQPNRGILRSYPDGSRFDDVLSTSKGVFEHRMREKLDGNDDTLLLSGIVLGTLIDRLEGFQSGQYACAENQNALEALRMAQNALKYRTEKRLARGVEGTHTV